MPPIHTLPTLNATLNTIATILLIAGFIAIRKRNIPAHRISMITAFIASTLFLASYLYYHFHHPSTPYPKHDWTRPLYFTILISHIILAILMLPMIFITFYHALKNNLPRHRAIARITWPIWIYVSFTGVIIYLMLYIL
jgi:putative membrane protein